MVLGANVAVQLTVASALSRPLTFWMSLMLLLLPETSVRTAFLDSALTMDWISPLAMVTRTISSALNSSLVSNLVSSLPS